jgi:Flp pilus assembly pilin Flp
MRKAASAVEYAFLIITVVAALLAMRLFLMRSIAGKWRQAADSIGFDQQYYF